MDFLKEENRIYSIDENGKLLAEITFPEESKGVFNINHTFVDESLRGQHIAGKLVEMAIEEIKNKGGKVEATCSYAKHYLEKVNKKQIILASNNINKLKELREKLSAFNIEVISQKEAGFDIEVEETGTTFEENAILKAEAIYELCKKPVIAEDSGLEIDCLDGMPGVYSHRYAGENATDEDRINKVLNLMKDVPEEKRTARFKCVGCYIDKTGQKHIFEGTAEGKIANEPQGENGFGYDPIFICELGTTFAKISSEEKNSISHRGRMTNAFIKYLEESV